MSLSIFGVTVLSKDCFLCLYELAPVLLLWQLQIFPKAVHCIYHTLGGGQLAGNAGP